MKKLGASLTRIALLALFCSSMGAMALATEGPPIGQTPVGMAEALSAKEKVSLSRNLFTYGEAADVTLRLSDDLLRLESWSFSDGAVEDGVFCAAGDHAVRYVLALKDSVNYAPDLPADMLRGEIPFAVEPVVINLSPLAYPVEVAAGTSIEGLDLNRHFKSPVPNAVLGWTDSGELDSAYGMNLFSYSLFDADTMALLNDTGNYMVCENLVSIVPLAQAEPVTVSWHLFKDGAFVGAYDGAEPMPSFEERLQDPYTYTVAPEFASPNGVTPTPSQYALTPSSFGGDGIHTVTLALPADGAYALRGGADNQTATFAFGIVAAETGGDEQPDDAGSAPTRPTPRTLTKPTWFYTSPGEQPKRRFSATASGAHPIIHRHRAHDPLGLGLSLEASAPRYAAQAIGVSASAGNDRLL